LQETKLEFGTVFLACLLVSKIHCCLGDKITEWLKLEVTSGGHLVQPPCSSRAT